MFVTGLAALVGLINIGSSTAFNDVVSLVLEGFYSSYLMACTLLLYRRVKGDIGDADSALSMSYRWGPWRAPGALGTIINACACIYLIILSFFSLWPAVLPLTPANMNYSSLVTGSVIIFGTAFYFFSAHRIYKGPIVDTELHTL